MEHSAAGPNLDVAADEGAHDVAGVPALLTSEALEGIFQGLVDADSEVDRGRPTDVQTVTVEGRAWTM